MHGQYNVKLNMITCFYSFLNYASCKWQPQLVTVKMEAVSSPDTSEDSSTTRRQNPNEDHQMITTAVKT